jgi:adenosine 3'-phospho 5'-phosphosulfate transporter B3
MRGSGPDVELAASLLGDRAGESSSSGSGSGSGKDGSGRDGSGRDAPVARLWGVPLRMSDRHLAYFLGVGAVSCYLGFTATQEGVFRSGGPGGFAHGGAVTLVTTFVYCVLALIERVRANDTRRKGAWRDYVLLAVLTSGGMYMTNAALRYLNYTTRIVAKSSKVIPTMILGTVMQGRRYGREEYASACVLVMGIALFTIGDVDTLPSFHPKGIALILFALFADSAAGNFEERRFFDVPDPCSHAEVVYHANLIGAGFTLIGMFLSGELAPAIDHVALNGGAILPAIVLSAGFGYMSVSFILLLIRHFGASNTEVVKSMRKMISIAASMVLYPKPLAWQYAGGLVSTIAGLGWMYAIKRRKLLAAGGSVEATK